jgi:glycosyl transferase family 2
VHAEALGTGPVIELESPPPAPIPAGVATAVFLYGICFHPERAVTGITLLVDGVVHAPAAVGMPRPDSYERYAAAAAFRSGFWAVVPVPAGSAAGDEVRIDAEVRLSGGDRTVVPLTRIEIRAPQDTAPEAPVPGLIAVCMATFEPDRALFDAQISSLREQTDSNWICVISDDCSAPEHVERIERAVAGDDRFTVVRGERRLGFYRNFERAIALAPPEAELLALCDQDDVWFPDKLAELRDALGVAGLVYSDQRLVDADGRVLRDTLWDGRRNNHTDLASLLVANSVTGAATLFRREIARLALPFPETPGLQFHDHWLGLVALAAGDVAYVDRPLYDYVQHAGAIFGEVSQQRRGARARGLLRGGRGAYFLGYAPRVVQAEALLARCARELTPAKRRALRRFRAAGRSPIAFAWLALRPLRVLAGRDETLGSESELARGIAWRWLVAALARGAAYVGRRAGDARFPDPLSFEQRRLRRWRARL